MTFNRIMKYAGFIFISLGLVFLVIQKTYYGYMDDQGVIHDSIFLPLGTLSLSAGILCLVIFLGLVCAKKLDKTNKISNDSEEPDAYRK